MSPSPTDHRRPVYVRDLRDDHLHELGKPPGDNNDFAALPVIEISYSGDDGGFWTAQFGGDFDFSTSGGRWVAAKSPRAALDKLLECAEFYGLNLWAKAELRRKGRLEEDE